VKTTLGTKVYCEAAFNYADGTVTQPVLDARWTASADLPFEECGFTRVDHLSSVRNWNDAEAVDSQGRDEFGELAREFTGCDDVVVYPAIARNPDIARAIADYAPITFVHSDYTDDYRPMVTDPARRYLDAIAPAMDRYGVTRKDVRDAARLMMLQSWRNVGPLRPDYPLAFCDARDVSTPSRLVPFLVPEYGGEPVEFYACTFTAPAAGADSWYTYPALRDDEAVLLRTYDSARAEQGLPFWTPHSAFRDPSVDDGPEHRRASVELRALCVWR
jgi:hypothetical protein